MGGGISFATSCLDKLIFRAENDWDSLLSHLLQLRAKIVSCSANSSRNVINLTCNEGMRTRIEQNLTGVIDSIPVSYFEDNLNSGTLENLVPWQSLGPLSSLPHAE